MSLVAEASTGAESIIKFREHLPNITLTPQQPQNEERPDNLKNPKPSLNGGLNEWATLASDKSYDNR
jgi:hypothetical protein